MTFPAKLRELMERATPGPWDYDEGMTPFYNDAEGESRGGYGIGTMEVWAGFESDSGEPNFVSLYALNNAALLCYLANHAAALLAVVESSLEMRDAADESISGEDGAAAMLRFGKADEQFRKALAALDSAHG